VQAETFQNTTIIVVLDVSYHPKDEDVVQKVGPSHQDPAADLSCSLLPGIQLRRQSACQLPNYDTAFASQTDVANSCWAEHRDLFYAVADSACTLLLCPTLLALQIVQYMTVDYGMEFCDFYGARCNRQLVETCRVKAVQQIPKDVKMSWVEHKVPIPPKGYSSASHMQSSPDTASPEANSPAASAAAAAAATPAAISFPFDV
jgi:hypothetical protein